LYTELLTGAQRELGARVRLADVFSDFPVALLLKEPQA
jgi:maltooligosyltrehalose synthase